MINNPAFELLKKYKKVEPDTETLVLKRIRGRISQDELITIFEKGVTGEYGKFIVADPQTLLSWVNQYESGKSTTKNYLASGLLDPDMKITSHAYPSKSEDWHREANKCLVAFMNGVNPSNFHPHVYDRMMLDGKIEFNAYKKYTNGFTDEDYKIARQKVLGDVFGSYRAKGWNSVYIVV